MPGVRLKRRAQPGLPYSGSTVGRSGVSVDFAAHGRLRVASDNRNFEHIDGTPFRWVGDTGWEIFSQTTLAEATAYLEQRRAQGITVVQCCLHTMLDHTAPSRNDAVHMFTGDAVAAPNATYFAYVDAIIDVAATKGIVLAITAVWAGNYAPELINKFDATSGAAFGDYLKTQFATKNNIIWIVMGDNYTPPAGQQTSCNAIGTALGTRFPRTTHPGGEQRSSTYFGGQSWFDFDMTQASHGSVDNSLCYSLVTDGRAAVNKPVVNSEPMYENQAINFNAVNGFFTAHDVRVGLYWGLFAGAAGTTYGNSALVTFQRNGYTPSGSQATVALWQAAIAMPASTQVQYLRNLVDSRPWGYVPDDTLVTSVSSGSNRIVGARTASSSFIYIPMGAAFTANLGKISGASVNAYWFNPSTGAVTFINTYTNSSTQAFTPPTAGATSDWVLILDDAAVNFPVPGFGTYQ